MKTVRIETTASKWVNGNGWEYASCVESIDIAGESFESVCETYGSRDMAREIEWDRTITDYDAEDIKLTVTVSEIDDNGDEIRAEEINECWESEIYA